MPKPQNRGKFVTRKVAQRENSHPLLDKLEQLFELQRAPNPAPPYPYNEKQNLIRIPEEIEQQLRKLVQSGQKVEAIKQVIELTGAGLRVSKDYVDSLIQ
jgi:ribosomal protein L7/L12